MKNDKSKGLLTDFSDDAVAERIRQRIGTTEVSLAPLPPHSRPGAEALKAAAKRQNTETLMKGNNGVDALRSATQDGDFSQE